MLSKNLTKLGYLGRTNTQNTNIPFYDEGTPSLDLNFAGNKNLVDNVSSNNLVTFTRASGGTYVDSNGLIKTAVTNLTLRSQEFQDVVWIKYQNAFVTPNTAIAPNGTMTADTLSKTTTPDGLVYQTAPTGGVYTLSFYCKANTATQATVAFTDGLLGRACTFNLVNGTAGPMTNYNGAAPSITGGTAAIFPAENGWYRCAIEGVTLSTGKAYHVGPGIVNSSTAESIFVWGAQLEQSSTVGEYIPTTSTINSAPRFDHNPTTGESLGLLVEEARTNLQGNSELLTAASWLPADATIVASGTGPNNGTAYEITETTTTNNHSFAAGGVSATATTSVTSGSTYTGSIFLKRSTVDWVQLSLGSAGFGSTLYINFNLATGAIGNSSGCTGTITSFANGWYRCAITATASTTTTATNNLVVAFTNNTNNTTRALSYAGSTANKFFATMGQFELGSFATSYIPTTTAQVTRAADVASITGSNFTSWYRQDEGTNLIEFREPDRSSNRTPRSFSDGTSDNRWDAFFSSTSTVNHRVVISGVANNPENLTLSVGNFLNKHVIAVGPPNANAACNGTLATPSTSSAVPNVNRLIIGADSIGGTPFTGQIRRITYWPKRLSNTTLENITK